MTPSFSRPVCGTSSFGESGESVCSTNQLPDSLMIILLPAMYFKYSPARSRSQRCESEFGSHA